MFRRASAVTAVLGVALMVVTGCGGSPAPAESTPSFSSEDEAFAAAEATYRAYVDALNQVDLADPATFEPVFALTVGDLNANDRSNFSQWHAEGLQLVGDATVPKLEFVETQPSDTTTVTVIEACYDVTNVDVLDESGASLVEEGRPDVQTLRVSVESSGAAYEGKISTIEPAVGIACS